jgi:hypothetical protein
MRPESRRVVVRLKDGESHEVTEREVSMKPEGVEIVLSWRETSADSPDRSEVPSRWVLYPWHLLVLSLDDRDGSSTQSFRWICQIMPWRRWRLTQLL